MAAGRAVRRAWACCVFLNRKVSRIRAIAGTSIGSIVGALYARLQVPKKSRASCNR
ncbi:MAG: patatin-like phospholipase family protein [Rheinheimera sp.]|nr:patatin-like phospholipase family protein [Rheinheimera sp.]